MVWPLSSAQWRSAAIVDGNGAYSYISPTEKGGSGDIILARLVRPFAMGGKSVWHAACPSLVVRSTRLPLLFIRRKIDE
ncbi:hypothetical protein [Geobacillus sp. TFV-3]|uniref:hypothetical protein n=1 Tax=Geobacillus sp. TFV-3 TaxID=1897059 RepID=UPI00135CD40A|nr:hypothetical protein [Geobacillus sp. TFV-3]